MADGPRITEAGSGNRRFTEDGNRRITEGAEMLDNVSVVLAATATLAAHGARHRAASVTLAATTTLADVATQRQRSVQANLSATATVLAGKNLPAIRRLTESGEIRRTQVGNTRVVHYGPESGNIVVRRPIFRIHVKYDGLWHVINLTTRRASAWQVPARAYANDQGQWRIVKTTQPRE